MSDALMTPIVSSLIPIMIALLLCPPKQALSLAATYILTVTEACELEVGQQLERAALANDLAHMRKGQKLIGMMMTHDSILSSCTVIVCKQIAGPLMAYLST